MAVVLLVASVAGLINAAVFTGIMWGWIRLGSPFVRVVCRLDAGDCTRVTTSPRARLFGVPNSLLGVLWCLISGVAAAVGLSRGRLPFAGTLITLSAFTVAVSLYLAWSLATRLRVRCGFCYLGHVVNVVIFAALVFLRFG